MSTGRAAIQVGILVVLGAALFVCGFAFFRHEVLVNKLAHYTVTFKDAQGLAAGSDVYYSGVLIGQVDSVGIDGSGRAQLILSIDKKIRIPIAATVSISSSLLGGSAEVDITPPDKPPVSEVEYYHPGASIAGQQSVGIAQLQAQAGTLIQQMGSLMTSVRETTGKANTLLDNANHMTKSMDSFISDPRLQGNLRDTAANIDAASEQGLQLTGQIRSMLNEDNALAKASLGHVDATTAQVAGLVSENRTKINTMIANLNTMTVQMDDLVTKTNQTLTNGGAVQNLSDTMASMKSAAQKLNTIEDDLHSMTGDPTIQKNIKTTIANAASLSGHTDELVAKLNVLAGGHGHKFSFNPTTQLVFLQNFGAHQFRTDFDLYAPVGTTDFARVGLRDLTETNRLNLQYGMRSTYNSRVSYRAGIYDSKVGVGLDYDVFGPRHFSVDLFDPNLLRVDIRQRFPLSKESALWLGLENVPRTNQVTLGFELHK